MGKKDKEIISQLISTLKILEFTKDSGKDLDIRDIFIASICIDSNIHLMTNNKKHFERMKKFGLKII